jgi:hypothetical protein
MNKSRRDTSTARNVWKSFYGNIPKDALGRSYEIHHIDGNCHNNNIDNLSCITIEDHYKIHLSQGEVAAANLILERIGSLEVVKNKSKWVNKDGIEKLVCLEKIHEYINRGWELGMPSLKGVRNPMHKKNGRKPPTLNKKWINNKKVDILVYKYDLISYINVGWNLGRCKISGSKNKKSFLGRFGSLHPKSKRVSKIDISTHKIISTYDGIREAMRDLDKKTTNITKSCRSYEQYKQGLIKKPSSAGGYYWSYEKID